MTTVILSSYPWQHGQSGCVEERDIDRPRSGVLFLKTKYRLELDISNKKNDSATEINHQLVKFSEENICSEMY